MNTLITLSVLSLLKVVSVAAAAVAATATVHVAGRDAAPNGPTDAGITKYCTFYAEPQSQVEDCQYLENYWGVSHDDFVAWNPAVKEDCSGLIIGHSYCVEFNNGQPVPTTTSNMPTSLPSPTQEDLTKDCKAFYFAKKGDTCNKIVEIFGTFTLADFTKWNPAVGDDCSGLWASTYYCVGVSGTPTTRPTATHSSGNPGPSPTQDGIVKECTAYYQAGKGDTCDKIVQKYSSTFTLAQFLKWNPAVGNDCSGLWATYFYCIAVPGTPTHNPTTLKTTASATTKVPVGPSPTQDGIISTCQRYYQAVKGDDCSKIVDKYKTFTLSDFIKWNPAVGSDCSGLWLSYYYCIGIPGTPTKPVPATTTSKKPTGCATAPTPTQPGALCSCKKWHKVAKGDTCDSIEKKYKISAGNFNKWNPKVGSDCKTLWLGYNVCVG